ncbi:DUF2188 domain-containing protein [Aquimarina agarilytica]|uniref:DUF2188 domain-containing protein n=1 Tax=Aquimarina agarilytica TaxID=1087449 RepID=UPI0009DA5815
MLCYKKEFIQKKLGNSVAVSAKPLKSSKYHVIVGGERKWTLVADGNTRATKVFGTRLSVIEFAKQTAHKINGEVIIHTKTGEIENRISFAG